MVGMADGGGIERLAEEGAVIVEEITTADADPEESRRVLPEIGEGGLKDRA